MTSTSDATDRVFLDGEARLEATVRAWASAKTLLVTGLFDSISQYKNECKSLFLQREEILKEISQGYPHIASALEDDFELKIPDANQGIFDRDGILLSFWPDNQRNPAINRGVLNLPLSEPSKPLQPPGNMTLDHDLDTCKVQLSRPKAKSKKRLQSTRPSSKPSSYLLTNRELRPRLLSTESDAEAVSKSECVQDYMAKDPISTSEVLKKNYWVFECRMPLGCRSYTQLFVMRCPSEDCKHPVFSKHPLHAGKAMAHLKACGFKCKGRQDMIRKYARMVLEDRKNTRAWAKSRNRKLLGANEMHLEQENIDGSIDIDIDP